jgi:biotin transport system substrate-specific component
MRYPPARLAADIARLAAAIALLGRASQISVTLGPTLAGPVPLTLQSLAVPGVGIRLNHRRSAAAVVAWLALAGLGLLLLAEGKSRVSGPTLGYLAAMPFAAAIVGAMAVARPHLPTMIGPERALVAGVLPFLSGALIKSFAAALCAPRLRKRSQSANQRA